MCKAKCTGVLTIRTPSPCPNRRTVGTQKASVALAFYIAYSNVNSVSAGKCRRRTLRQHKRTRLMRRHSELSKVIILRKRDHEEEYSTLLLNHSWFFSSRNELKNITSPKGPHVLWIRSLSKAL